MADDIVSVRSVQLHELLGSTMTAVIRADGLAAQATLDFIETVGFSGAATTGDDGASAGQLRMATFRYSKLDENNQPAEFVAEIPVLSLVPVPALQIDEAKFSLAVKIDAVSTPAGATPQESIAVPAKTRLFGRPAYSSGARNEEVRSTHHLEIEVTMRQADIPVGLEKVFNLMDQAIQDRKAT